MIRRFGKASGYGSAAGSASSVRRSLPKMCSGGPAGGIYDDISSGLSAVSRPRSFRSSVYSGRQALKFTVIPAVDRKVTHRGTFETIDLAYGALAAHVARHELGVAGPIREYYPVDGTTTPNSSAWQTEIGSPIFTTGERA